MGEMDVGLRLDAGEIQARVVAVPRQSVATAAAVGWLLTCMIFVVSLVQIRLSTYVGSEK